MHQKSVLLLAAVVVVCFGCATKPPEPYLVGKAVLVSRAGLDRYWTQNTRGMRPSLPPGSGCATFHALIDSNGNVYDLELLNVNGVNTDRFKSWAYEFISNWTYIPSRHNSNRTPVQTVLGVWMQVNGDGRFMNQCSQPD